MSDGRNTLSTMFTDKVKGSIHSTLMDRSKNIRGLAKILADKALPDHEVKEEINLKNKVLKIQLKHIGSNRVFWLVNLGLDGVYTPSRTTGNPLTSELDAIHDMLKWADTYSGELTSADLAEISDIIEEASSGATGNELQRFNLNVRESNLT